MKIFLSVILVFTYSLSIAQQIDYPIEEAEHNLDSLINKTMQKDHIPGAAIIVVKDGKVILQRGYGYTNLGIDINYVDPDSTIFRIGSITKTFTATALLQLVDEGKIGLHDDVNKYLKSVKVPATYSQPITVHHLLTHSSGFDELQGRRVFEKNQLISLDSFLSNRLVRIREPGLISSYSTYAIALAGLLVEDISGQTLEDYMKEHIWQPLGMSKTSIELPESHVDFLSIGYENYKGINIPQPWEWYHTFPASSINSTVVDMSKYMLMLLNNGSMGGQSILSPKSALQMQTPQLSTDSNISGFAYGFYEKKFSGILTYSHGGDMLGYSSFITLIPEKNMGIFVVHHHEGTNLRRQVVSLLMEKFGEIEKTNLKSHTTKSDLTRFVGKYKWMTYCHTCTNSSQPDEKPLTMNDDGTLSGFGRRFYQIGPLLFKSLDGERTMGFHENSKGEITFMSLGNINTFEKVN